MNRQSRSILIIIQLIENHLKQLACRSLNRQIFLIEFFAQIPDRMAFDVPLDQQNSQIQINRVLLIDNRSSSKSFNIAPQQRINPGLTEVFLELASDGDQDIFDVPKVSKNLGSIILFIIEHAAVLHSPLC
jgi:hypothetical protein